MVTTHYLQLHPHIQVCTGYSRSLLIDTNNSNYWFIHNDYAHLFEKNPCIQLKNIQQHLPHHSEHDIKTCINLLLSENLGFLSPISQKIKTNPLQPSPSTALVHTISVETSQKMPVLEVETINECFGDYTAGTLVFHCLSTINLYTLLTHYSTSLAENIHLFLDYAHASAYDFKRLCKFAPKLKQITITESPREKTEKKENCYLIYLTSESDQLHRKYSLLQHQPLIPTWQTHHNYFNKRVHITQRGEVKNAFEARYSMGNILTEHLRNILQKKEFQAFWKITKNQIDVCNDCEFRAICIDRRILKKRANGTWFAKEECTYNPYIYKELGETNYLTLNQCGVYCRGQGFRMDVERFIEIRNRILTMED